MSNLPAPGKGFVRFPEQGEPEPSYVFAQSVAQDVVVRDVVLATPEGGRVRLDFTTPSVGISFDEALDLADMLRRMVQDMTGGVPANTSMSIDKAVS